MTHIAVLFLALALAGCNVTSAEAPPPPAAPSGPPPTANIPDKELFRQARAAVVANLKDPESARFGDKFDRRINRGRDGVLYEVVCGEVNARNGFGGYTGSKMFLWTASDIGIRRVIMADSDSIDRLLTKAVCTGESGSTPSQGPPEGAASRRAAK